jgi:hypothetical protein
MHPAGKNIYGNDVSGSKITNSPTNPTIPKTWMV